MQPPQTPIPPGGSNPRRGMTPSILSPSFSRRPFSTTAGSGGGQDAAGSEHPCITLIQWWLAKLEGDDERIAVAGVFERNKTVEDFAPALIAKRHEACVLETEDGIILLIYGSPNIKRMLSYGYSSQVCEKFMIGFPYWWQSYNLLYPPSSSNTSNSKVDPRLFYLKMFQLGEHVHSHGSSLLSKLNSVNRSSHNDAAFQKSSHLPNGAPRFEEYTSNGQDVPTSVCPDVSNSSYLPNENAAASNDDGERDEAVCNEVDNVETDLTSAVECANDARNEDADTAPSMSDKRTSMDSLKMQGRWEKTQHITLSKKAAIGEEMPTSVCLDVQNSSDLSKETPRFEKNTYVGDIPTNGDAAASNDNSERCPAVPKEVDSIETGLAVDSTRRETGHDDITNVSLAPIVECTNDEVSEGVHSNPLLGCKQTPEASLKSQGCQEKCQHTPSNEKPSGLPKKRRSALEKLQGPIRSPFTSPVSYAHDCPLTRGRITSLSMSTPEALKLRKTRSGRVVVPSLDAGCQRIVYDMDGTIAGVVGLDSPSSKGSKLKAYATKKSAEPAAASKLKASATKKNAEPAAASKLKASATTESAEQAAGSKLKASATKKSAEPAAASKLKASATKKNAEPAAASKLKASATTESAEQTAGSKLKMYARKKRIAEPASASKPKTYARKKRRAE